MLKLTRANASELRAQNKDNTPAEDFVEIQSGETLPTQRPQEQLLRPAVNRRNGKNYKDTPMTLSKYGLHLLAFAISRFIDQTTNPTGAFENRNENRDLFIVSSLKATNNNVKDACLVLTAKMEGAKVPRATILSTLDALFYSILKQATYSVWLDNNRAMRVEEGLMPDSYFDKLMERAPAAENNEVDINDLRAGHDDHREDTATAPIGLDTDYVEIGGFEWQIDDGETPLHSRIIQGLEDLRVYLENIRLIFDKSNKERLPFFIEQIGAEWVRHNGDVYSALIAYGQKNDARNRQRAVDQDRFYREEAARMTKATA